MEPVLATITEACTLVVSPDNYEMLDYQGIRDFAWFFHQIVWMKIFWNPNFQADLRESCLEAFTGIIQGLKGDENNPQSNQVRKLEQHLNFIFQFLSTIAVDKERGGFIFKNLHSFSD